jgi:hypothetical protein
MSQPAVVPIRLVPLLCVKCRAPVAAQPNELAWVCEQCGQGLLLNASPTSGPNESATSALDIFFSNAIKAGQKGRPFWVSPGRVTITDRQTYKGDEGGAARAFWSSPRLFCVPAWETTLSEIISTGVSLLINPQRLEQGAPVPFHPVVTPPVDVRGLADFMVVSIEADRRDALKTIHYDLKLEPLQLWILP